MPKGFNAGPTETVRKESANEAHRLQMEDAELTRNVHFKIGKYEFTHDFFDSQHDDGYLNAYSFGGHAIILNYKRQTLEFNGDWSFKVKLKDENGWSIVPIFMWVRYKKKAFGFLIFLYRTHVMKELKKYGIGQGEKAVLWNILLKAHTFISVDFFLSFYIFLFQNEIIFKIIALKRNFILTFAAEITNTNN